MFPQRLKELRKKNGKITQAELADTLGISQQAVGLWETGKTMPDYPAMIQLADLFHVSIDYLLGHEVAQPESSAGAAATASTDEEKLLLQQYNALNSEEKASARIYMNYMRAQREAAENPGMKRKVSQ